MLSTWRRFRVHQPTVGIRVHAGTRSIRQRFGRAPRSAVRRKPEEQGAEHHDAVQKSSAISDAARDQQAQRTAPQQPEDHKLQKKPNTPFGDANQPGFTPPPHLNTKNKPISTIPPSILYEHWDLAAPSTADLKESRTFFMKHPAKLLFTAAKLLDVPFTSTPEIAIVGRSNVGKSTLLNALLQTQLAKTSSKPGKTKTMNAYSLGGGKMTLLDMPGYGRASREEWGREITKYLQRRRELRRVFVLIDAIHKPDEGRVKHEDLEMLAQLREMHIPHQIVLGKVDRALFTRDMRMPLTEADLVRCAGRVRAVFEDVKRIVWGASGSVGAGAQSENVLPPDGLMPFGQLLAVTGDTGKWAKLSDERSGALGVDALRWALLVATGYAKVLPSRMQERKTA